ncbi:MAG TPA: hypothetical protein VHW23_17345 [Kofleriaceae bacterium]|nr:hypothetical protein [Kofleriaceae bacterium]
MKPGWLTVLACAGCAMPAEPFPVVAEAQLMPRAEDITGPIQILDANSAYAQVDDFALHTLTAYQVRLPDTAPRRVVIYDAGSCDDPPSRRTRAIADLQMIRKVGNETHFFAHDILVEGHRVDIDIKTAQAEFSLDADPFFGVLGKIVVVLAADSPDMPPSTYLACGAFVATPSRP